MKSGGGHAVKNKQIELIESFDRVRILIAFDNKKKKLDKNVEENK